MDAKMHRGFHMSEDYGLSSILSEIELLLQNALRGTSGRIRKFLLFQLWDAWRTCVAISYVVKDAQSDKKIPADAVEVLARKVLEHAIVSSYVKKHGSSAVVDRFLKTSAKAFEKSWKIEHHTEDKNLIVKELPDYRGMANDVGGELYEIYSKLSYISHPRAAQPYSMVEYESKLDPSEFFRRRIKNVIPLVINLLNILKRNFLTNVNESQRNIENEHP